MAYRVVYGETMPTWEKMLPTKAEAEAFAAKQRSFGDIVFSIKRARRGDGAHSIMAALDEKGKP